MTYRYLPAYGLRALQIVLLVESLFRGITYLAVPKQGTIVLTDIEASAPMQVWGLAFISCAVIGLFGEALMSGTKEDTLGGPNPRAWPSFIAHSLLMILYTTMSFAYAASVFNGRPVLAQASFAMGVFAYGHWLFARRRKRHVAV